MIERTVRQLVEEAVNDSLEAVVAVKRRGPDPTRPFFDAAWAWRIDALIAAGQWVGRYLPLRLRTVVPMAAHLCLSASRLYAVELREAP